MSYSQSAASVLGLSFHVSSDEWETQVNSLESQLRKRPHGGEMTPECPRAIPTARVLFGSTERSVKQSLPEEGVTCESNQQNMIIAPFGYIVEGSATSTPIEASGDVRISRAESLSFSDCTSANKREAQRAQKRRSVRFVERSKKCKSCEQSRGPCIFAVDRQRQPACESCRRKKRKCSEVPGESTRDFENNQDKAV